MSLASSCQCSRTDGTGDAHLDGDVSSESEGDVLLDADEDATDARASDLPDWATELPPIPGDPWYCPPSQGVVSEFVVDGDPAPTSTIEIETSCTVSGITYHSVPDGLTVQLSCELDTNHEVEIRAFPPFILALVTGDEVTFNYLARPAEEDPDTFERWFKLSFPEGDLVVGGSDASEIFPSDGPFRFEPVYCSHSGSCDRSTFECYEEERVQVHCRIIGDPAGLPDGHILDGREGWVGLGTTYFIRLGEARERENITCPGIPSEWYKLLLAIDG
jgi:hypothetical protein